MWVPTAYCPPDHIRGLSKGGSPSTHSTRRRAFAALNRRSAACCTLPPALPSASAIADGRTDGKIAVSCASACARKDTQSCATERAKPHSSALAAKRRMPSIYPPPFARARARAIAWRDPAERTHGLALGGCGGDLRGRCGRRSGGGSGGLSTRCRLQRWVPTYTTAGACAAQQQYAETLRRGAGLQVTDTFAVIFGQQLDFG